MENTSFQQNNRRIARNTMFLYFRTFIIMLISLYTSRAVLKALGETDFGIYNLVGGIVVLFSFMNSAMSAAVQRYLNFELGRGNIIQVARIFSMSMTAHICIAVIVLILGETLGLWFVMTQLNIPIERYSAAMWAYHLSLMGCCMNILRIPYNACIIAYERMSFYAYVSIIEALFRLAIVFLLVIGIFDGLIFYAFLMLIVVSIVNIIYLLYCRRNFRTSRYHYFWDRSLFAQLMSFSGWSMFGSLANAGVGQAMSVLLNIFYGVTLNAALGISHQVHSALASFVSSFQTAFSPQIVKTYASGQRKEFDSLICRTSRLSYCLVFVVAPALIICISPLLNAWLTIVPKYTNAFAITSIVLCMIDALSGPLWVSVQATGNIKRYQMLVTSVSLLNIPFMYYLLILGVSPIWVVGVRVIIAIVIHFVRIYYLGRKLDFPVSLYMKDVMLRVIIMSCLSLPMSIFLYPYVDHLCTTFFIFFLIVTQNTLLSFVVGMPKSERKAIFAMLTNRIRQFKYTNR